MSSGGSGATQVYWLLGPPDPPVACTGAKEDGVHGRTCQESQQCLSGGQLTALCAGAVPQMGDFRADKADNQLPAQSILF